MAYNTFQVRGLMRRSALANYRPNNEKFLTWHVSEATIRAIFGGNRTGKTEAGGFEAVCASLGKRILDYADLSWTPEMHAIAEKWAKIGAQSGWVASVSYELQADGCQEKIERYLPKEEIKSIAYLSRVKNQISQINLKNGKNISFKSYEQGAKDFQSAGKGWIWFDEEPPKDIWKECSVRTEAGLTLYRWLTMTPVQGMTWVFDEIYLNKLRNPNIFKIQVGWNDNPHLTEAQLDQMSSGLTEEELQVRRDGKFTKRQGLVYKLFNQTTHCVPADWTPTADRYTFYRSLDFGFADSHPFVCLYFAVDNTSGDIYCYDELYLRETGQKDTLEAIAKKSKPFNFYATWADSARPDWIDYMNTHNIPTYPAKKDKVAGIAKVTEYFAIHPVTGRPRLFISDRCIQLIEEMEKYAYPKANQQEYGKNEPEKKFDNGPDALRYFVFNYTDDEGSEPLQQTGEVEGLGGVMIPTYNFE